MLCCLVKKLVVVTRIGMIIDFGIFSCILTPFSSNIQMVIVLKWLDRVRVCVHIVDELVDDIAANI